MDGPPAGFERALGEKYAILRLAAEAQANQANADANLTKIRAGLLPAESQAGIGLTRAQTGLAQANTRSVDENTKFVKPLAEASVFNTRMQGSLYGQQAVGESQLNTMTSGLLRKKGIGLPSADMEFGEKLKSILREGLGYR